MADENETTPTEEPKPRNLGGRPRKTEEPPDEIEVLKAELAALRAEKKAREEAENTEAPDSGRFLINFVRSGLTINNVVMEEGEEMWFEVGTPAYEAVTDLKGFNLLTLRRDPEAQKKLLGHVYFREGEFKGTTPAQIKYETLKNMANANGESITVEELAALERADRMRRREAVAPAPIL